MDLSGIPTEDLQALKNKDLGKVSTATLQKLKGEGGASPPPTLPKNTAGQTIYPMPKEGLAPHPPGTDPVPDAARGVVEGFKGQPTPPGANIPERVGAFVGREGPAAAGMMGAAALTGGAGLPMALGAAALGGGAGEKFRQYFGQKIGGAQLSEDEGRRLVMAEALKGAAAEVGGRVTAKTFQIIKNAMPEALGKLASMPAEYVRRAIERQASALPRAGETLASVEKDAINHLQGVQSAMEEGRAASGRMVDRALENLHVKTGGKQIADTQPLADAMRKIIDDKYRSADPTMQALAKSDMNKIAKVIRTMEAQTGESPTGILNSAGKPIIKTTFTKPMKSIKDLVQIRRELDNMVGYTPQGLPKMNSDMGTKFAQSLASEFRGLIGKTAESLEDKRLLLANARFSNMAKNYDEWQPVFTTKTEGEPAMISKMRGLDSYISKGGAASESLKTLKEAFPRASSSVDAMHDALTRRAFIKSPDIDPREIKIPIYEPVKNTLISLIRSMAGPGKLSSLAVKAANIGANQGGNAARTVGQAIPSHVIEALLAHIKPEDRNK